MSLSTHQARTAALVAIPVLLAYLTSLAGSFQFDDFNVIVDNPVVHSLAAWWADVPRGNRPLLKLSYTLNWITGNTALGFHLGNLAIHLVNTALVYLLTRRLIDGYGERLATTDAGRAALIAAWLFGLHPAQTEAVTYISGRSASLMAMFALGALLAYLIGTLQSRRRWSHLVSPALFVLAVATKESAVSLPLVLLVWELSRSGPIRAAQLLGRLWPHALALAAVAVTLLSHPVYASRVVPDFSPQALHDHLLTDVVTVCHLMTQLLAPWPLDIDPDLRAVTSWSSAVAMQTLVLLIPIGLAAWCWQRRPWLGLGVAWFYVVLLPTNSVLPRLDLANERQLYLAGVGLCIALAVEFELLRAHAGGWSKAGAIAVLSTVAALTAIRNLDYGSEVRLWQQTARVSPHKARVFNNLAFAYSAAGCRVEADAAYRRALALDPEYSLARDNLASLLDHQDLPADAACRPSPRR